MVRGVLVLTTMRSLNWPVNGKGDTMVLEGADDHIFQNKGRLSGDGKHVAVVNRNSVLVWRTDIPGPPLVLAGHNRVNH
jgi:hypothetical protein